MKKIKELWVTFDKSRIELWVIVILLSAGLSKLLSKLLSMYINRNNQTPFYYEATINPMVILLLLPVTILITMYILRISDIADEKTEYIDKTKRASKFILRVIVGFLKAIRWLFNGIVFVLFIIASALTGNLPGMSSKSAHSPYRGPSMWAEPDKKTKANNDARNRQEKAEFDARQKQREATYATHQAVKQGKYNSDTIYYKNAANRAVEKQREADKAKDDLKKY